jgi:hypothetical protein
MSLAETEIANVESITRSSSRFGLQPLAQFARAGLELKIGDYRQLCEELHSVGLGDDQHEVADVLFKWMTDKLDAEQSK